MSGHSKWATIKRKKAVIDAQRGKIFIKIIREITTAARLSGGDIEGNPRLRVAVLAAKEANMPADNISRAIKKGTGELEGVSYEEITYEGLGPGGVAVLIDCLTDNKNRTLSEVRTVFNKCGGSMAEAGAVSWNFHKKGVIAFSKDSVQEDALMEIALELGAEDVTSTEKDFEVLTDPQHFMAVKEGLERAGLKFHSAQLTKIPQNTIRVEGKAQAEKLLHLCDALEELDDAQNVYANFDIDEALMGEL